jgi:hypothetical protein
MRSRLHKGVYNLIEVIWVNQILRHKSKDRRYHSQKKKGQEKFEDTKGLIRGHNRRRADNTMSKRKRTKGQKQSTKHCTENKISSNTKSEQV